MMAKSALWVGGPSISALDIFCIKEPLIHQLDEWINKMCYTHTMEYYLAIKRSTDKCHSMDEPGKKP